MTLAALGAIAVGCGSGPGAAADAPSVDEKPPASADDAPTSNPDAPPDSADDPPPGNADAPRGVTPPAGGGGNDAEGLCRELCNSVDADDCESTGDLSLVISAICETGCQLNAAQQACAGDIAEAISCILNIDGLCETEPSQSQLAACQGPLERANECGPGGEPTPDPDPGPGEGCTVAESCMGCSDDCEACRCATGAQADQVCAAFCM